MATIGAPLVRTRTGFFFWMAVFLLACVIAGFGSSLLTGKYNDVEVPLPGYIILHGAVLLAWFSWLVLQTGLVRSGKRALHRTTGAAGAIIGLLVIFSSPFVYLLSPGRLLSRGLTWSSDMGEFPALGVSGQTVEQFVPGVVFGGIANTINFAILLGAALWWRAVPEVHKRLMLLASIAIFPPALARISRWPGLGGEDGTFLPIAVLLVLLIPLAHDKLATGKFHKATLAGVGLIIVVQLGLQVFASTEAGTAFVKSLA